MAGRLRSGAFPSMQAAGVVQEWLAVAAGAVAPPAPVDASPIFSPDDPAIWDRSCVLISAATSTVSKAATTAADAAATAAAGGVAKTAAILIGAVAPSTTASPSPAATSSAGMEAGSAFDAAAGAADIGCFARFFFSALRSSSRRSRIWIAYTSSSVSLVASSYSVIAARITFRSPVAIAASSAATAAVPSTLCTGFPAVSCRSSFRLGRRSCKRALRRLVARHSASVPAAAAWCCVIPAVIRSKSLISSMACSSASMATRRATAIGSGPDVAALPPQPLLPLSFREACLSRVLSEIMSAGSEGSANSHTQQTG